MFQPYIRTTKFITQFCFQLNKKTYALIVDYLKKHKDAKGQIQITYDDLWPQVIDDAELRTEIQNIPTKILRCLNKDISEAYHLLMESFSDSSLQKLFRYERIRDLYQFMTEIILKKNIKNKKERKENKDVIKQTPQKKPSSKKIKSSEKHNQTPVQEPAICQTQWGFIEERYLCALYLQRPLFKCCQKLKQKFGQNQKWNTTKKVFKKAEQIFEKSLKKAFRFTQLKSLKQMLNRLQMTKESLIAQIIKKKSNQIQKSVLRFYKTNDSKKKTKVLEEINSELIQTLQKPGIIKKEASQDGIKPKEENLIKKETAWVKLTQGESIQVDSSDISVSSSLNEAQIKFQTKDNQKSQVQENQPTTESI